MENIPLPSLDEVAHIATSREPVLRNLQITQCYHELSLAMGKRTGAVANWCTFATWASKQAGQTIRKEDLARALEHLLKSAPTTSQAADNLAVATRQTGVRREPEHLLQIIWEALNPLRAIERASDAVARGNQKVFAEIGYEFARFESAFLEDTTVDAEKIARFCETLREGDPPDGQRYLRQAFTRYYQAFFEPDPKTRLELMLLANLEIGFHEQTRLQPEIAEALEASIVDPGEFVRRLGGALFPYRGWAVYLLWLVMRLFNRWTQLDEAIQSLITAARHQVRYLLTEYMMVLEIPHEIRLRLGQDLHAEFPPMLQQVADQELCDFLAQIDPTPDSLLETGAVDWADLPDRIHFIVDLFRCYGESVDLMEPPFTPEQILDLKAGRLPNNPL